MPRILIYIVKKHSWANVLIISDIQQNSNINVLAGKKGFSVSEEQMTVHIISLIA